MSLSIQDPNAKKLKFKERLGMIGQSIQNSFAKGQLEAIFLVLIIGSFFANVKLILALFTVFYFLDRWEVKKLFIKNNEITVVHKNDEEQKNLRTGE